MNVVGIDIGGTFTDLVGWLDGRVVTSKTSTVPADPSEGVANSLTLAGCDLPALDEVLHGSTIAINTVLEKKGAITALITTKGFRDSYAIGRGNRVEPFNLFFRRPKPLVPREMTFEVAERMTAGGKVLQPLDEQEVRKLAQALVSKGVEAVAICFLHSYQNPTHERITGAIIRDVAPGMFVTMSHEIVREYREYERTSTTVLNAFVGPRVKNYLGRIDGYFRDSGFGGTIKIMRSNGGLMSIEAAQDQPVAMMESGPVAGMIGAGRLAKTLGVKNCIGFDMGGTTAKASLMVDGATSIEDGYVIGDQDAGQPMQLPVVDIVEVGTGGGSIAWCDEAGGLHVGPQSAGADPGPAAYGKGAFNPVITDANLVLGRLNGARFLNGAMKLDASAARRAIAKKVAEPLKISVEESALGIVKIADAAMSLAVRAVSVDKGIDPRDTVMIAFGGAGPLHAVAIAREIFIPKVIVPKLPGTFSALGMLMASWRQDFVRTMFGRLQNLDSVAVRAALKELLVEGSRALQRDGISESGASFEFLADLRYAGQEHAIQIDIGEPEDFVSSDLEARRAFDTEHARRFGHSAPEEPVEVVNLRLVVTAEREGSSAEQWLNDDWVSDLTEPDTFRPVLFSEEAGPIATRIVWRPSLAVGQIIEGPAVIEEPNATTLIHAGDVATVSASGHLMIDVNIERELTLS